MNHTTMNHAELTKIVEKYYDVVFRVALGYVKSIPDADDIAQNVFTKLIVKNKSFATDEVLKAWLIRVSINEAKDLLKTAWYRKRADLDESLVMPVYDDLGLYDYVSMLKPKYRTVIYLYYYEEYSIKEIAKILRMPQSSVATQLQRARNQLKEIIKTEEHCYG